ncbi:MAG: hypothetical protein IPO13_13440 [Rhodocyclaceae bacterium]|nr:hypothetical protein [Rhodocyclaceae bacterium]
MPYLYGDHKSIYPRKLRRKDTGMLQQPSTGSRQKPMQQGFSDGMLLLYTI